MCQKRGLLPGRDIAVTGYRALKCAVSLCKGSKPVKMRLPARFMLRQSCGCKRQVEELELSDILERIVSNSDKEMLEMADQFPFGTD